MIVKIMNHLITDEDKFGILKVVIISAQSFKGPFTLAKFVAETFAILHCDYATTTCFCHLG
jgi:hypothetical protein